MKGKFIIATLLSLCSILSQAQTKITIQGGIGVNRITKSEDYGARIGYRFGVGADFPINHTWSLQTGVQILNRNYGIDKSVMISGTDANGDLVATGLSIDAKTQAVYIQIPIKVAAFLPLNKNCGLQYSIGPYVAYGIGGESNSKWILATTKRPGGDMLYPGEEYKTVIQEKEINVKSFGKEGIKRLDIGLSLGADFKYKALFAGFSVEYGLLPIHKEFQKDIFKAVLTQDNTLISPHNFGLEVHVGYCFVAGKNR